MLERMSHRLTWMKEEEAGRERVEERNDQDEVNARLFASERDNRCSPPLLTYNACKATGELSEKEL